MLKILSFTSRPNDLQASNLAGNLQMDWLKLIDFVMFFSGWEYSCVHLFSPLVQLCVCWPSLPCSFWRQWNHRWRAKWDNRFQSGCATKRWLIVYYQDKIHWEDGKATYQRVLDPKCHPVSWHIRYWIQTQPG